MRTDEMTIPQPEIGDGPASAASAGAGSPTSADVCRAVIAGLRWTFRSEAAALLAGTPADDWRDPNRNGWQRIKQNGLREVWRAHRFGQEYYLKYSFTRGPAALLKNWLRGSPAQREWAGGRDAMRHQIAAVQPLAFCDDLRRAGRRCCLLVTPAVAPAQPLHEFWRRLSADSDAHRRRADTRGLIEELARLVARAHQAGFAHLDMHAANLLVRTLAPRRYQPLFVDLQSARLDRPLSEEAVTRNLVQLNQWFRRHSTVADRLRFLRAYLRWRNEFELELPHGRTLELDFRSLVAALERQAARHAGGLQRRRDRRCRGDGRYFSRLRLAGGWRGVVVLAERRATERTGRDEPPWSRAAWQAALQQPLRLLERASDAHKDSHSAQVSRAVLRCEAASVPVFIKRPRSRNARRALRNRLAPSRSLRAWRMGNALLNRDQPAARPLAVLERRVGPLVHDSLLITEAVPGAVDLETFLCREFERQPPLAWVRLKRHLTALLARQLRGLHRAGFAHRDCKASNLLVAPPPQLRLLWVDWDGLRQRRRVSPADELRALQRLHASVAAIRGITQGDRARFLRDYTARFGMAGRAWRELWRAIARGEPGRIAAAERRKAWKQSHYGRA